MYKLEDRRTLFVDVDDTLVMWSPLLEVLDTRYPTFTEDGFTYYGHLQNMLQLVKFKTRGYNVVVWSQAGSDWAERAVKGLNLEKFVDIIVPKPMFLLDDLDSSAWMPKSKCENLDLNNTVDIGMWDFIKKFQ